MSKRTRFMYRSTRGSLAVIASLLIGSAVMRLAMSADDAWAMTEEHLRVATEEVPQMEDEPLSDCQTEQDLEAMMQALSRKDARLNEREASLNERAEALSTADREISARMVELQTIEEELSRTLAIADQAAEKDIGKLVSVYENMKPKEAAALFEEMDPNFAAGFLARMQPEAAAGVMAGLSPNTAYTISVVLAGRNAEAPKE